MFKIKNMTHRLKRYSVLCFCTLSILISCFSVSLKAWAYTYLGGKWPTNIVNVGLEKATFPSIQSDFYTQGQNACYDFGSVQDANFVLYPFEEKNDANAYDGKNTVYFTNLTINTDDALATAMTTTYGACCSHDSNNATCCGHTPATDYYDVDIVFANNSFITPRYWVSNVADYELHPQTSSQVGFYNVMLHELGHLAGLAHETTSAVSFMKPYYTSGCYGQLHGDDKAALRNLYHDPYPQGDSNLGVTNWKSVNYQSQTNATCAAVAPPTDYSGIDAGGSTTVEFTVENLGTADAAAPMSFVLSKNTTKGDSDDIACSETSSIALGHGNNDTAQTVTQSVTIPEGTKKGDYYIITSVADSNNSQRNDVPSYQKISVTNKTPIIVPPSIISKHPGKDKYTVIPVTDDNYDNFTCSGLTGTLLNYYATLNPLWGFPLSAGCAFDWPAYDGNPSLGNYFFTLTVDDGQGGVAFAPVTVNVYNNAPTLPSLPEQRVAPVKSLNYSIPASDQDGDSLTCSMTPAITGATISGCTLNWTPTCSQQATYNETIKAKDNLGVESSPQPMAITVSNSLPTMNYISNKTVNGGHPLSFAVSATDPDQQTLTYSAANLPSGSSFTPSNQTFNWTPACTLSGAYPNVTFTAADPCLASASQLITITANPNPAPAMNLSSQTIDETQTLSLPINATDPDNDLITYGTPTNLPSGAVWDANAHTLNWTPSCTQRGTYSNIGFTVTDPCGAQTSQAITVTVNPNKPPSFNSIPSNQNAQTGRNFIYIAKATDTSSRISYLNQTYTDGATFTDNGDNTGTFSWNPPWYTEGYTYGFVVSAVDPCGKQGFGTVIVTVQAPPPGKPPKGYCFASNTPVLMANGTTKSIQRIKVGDSVRSFNDKTNSFENGQVTQTMHHIANGYILINDRIKITSNHPVYANGKWQEAGQLKVGDALANADGKAEPVVSLKEVHESSPVYNLEVAPGHTYVAGGVVVHNKYYFQDPP